MIIIYSTHHCPYCKLAKQYIDKKKVDYKEINVEEDEEAFEEMVKKSGQMGVPVIDVNGEVIVGFDRETLDELISK